MARTPHTWDEIIKSLRQLELAAPSAERCTKFLNKLVDRIHAHGYADLLSPVFSVGTIFIFLSCDNDKEHLHVYPLYNGLVQIELWHKDQDAPIRIESVPEDQAVDVTETYIKHLLSRSQDDSKHLSLS